MVTRVSSSSTACDLRDSNEANCYSYHIDYEQENCGDVRQFENMLLTERVTVKRQRNVQILDALPCGCNFFALYRAKSSVRGLESTLGTTLTVDGLNFRGLKDRI